MKTIIPAAATAAREGLEMSVTRLDGCGAERLLLGVGSGAVILALGPAQGKFIFSHGKLTLESTGGAEGGAFVDEVARWLGLELAPAPEENPVPGAGDFKPSWVRLGQGRDPFGVTWETFKLFFSLDERYAEVFLRLTVDGRRAQLVEKWSDYRERLVEILERRVAPPPPRIVRRRAEPLEGPSGEMRFGVQGNVELAIPDGWLLTQRPEGHYRLADLHDEMMIELSCVRLPPLPPDAPDVVARLQAVIDTSGHAHAATPITAFERDGATFAWSEHSFSSNDTNRPEAPPRAARERWLIASNPWVQVLVTGCWWEEDIAVATRGWDSVIASLRLAGRTAPLLTPDEQA